MNNGNRRLSRMVIKHLSNRRCPCKERISEIAIAEAVQAEFRKTGIVPTTASVTCSACSKVSIHDLSRKAPK